MSLAIDRNAVNEIVFLGQGVPRTETVVPASPYYQEDIETLNAEYDPATAESLLDGLGLVKGDDGFRTFPDGSDLLVVIETSGTGTGELDTYELVTEWWNAIGVKTELVQETREVFWATRWRERSHGRHLDDRSRSGSDGGPDLPVPVRRRVRGWPRPLALWYKTGGAEGEEPTDEFKAAMDLYDEYKVTTDPARQLEIGKELVRMATDQSVDDRHGRHGSEPGRGQEQLHERVRDSHCRLDHHDPRHAWTPRTSTSRTAASQ